jgi:hypothetical protein
MMTAAASSCAAAGSEIQAVSYRATPPSTPHGGADNELPSPWTWEASEEALRGVVSYLFTDCFGPKTVAVSDVPTTHECSSPEAS